MRVTGIFGRCCELSAIWLRLETSSTVTPYSVRGSARGAFRCFSPARACDGNAVDDRGPVACVPPLASGTHPAAQATSMAVATSRPAAKDTGISTPFPGYGGRCPHGRAPAVRDPGLARQVGRAHKGITERLDPADDRLELADR